MKPQSLTALAPHLEERAAVRRYRCDQLADTRPVEAVHELLPDGVGSVFDAKSAWGDRVRLSEARRSGSQPSCHQQIL